MSNYIFNHLLNQMVVESVLLKFLFQTEFVYGPEGKNRISLKVEQIIIGARECTQFQRRLCLSSMGTLGFYGINLCYCNKSNIFRNRTKHIIHLYMQFHELEISLLNNYPTGTSYQSSIPIFTRFPTYKFVVRACVCVCMCT